MKPTFKKTILSSTLVVLIGVGMFFALAYLSKPKSPSQTLPTPQGVYDGFQLTMTLEKTEYTLGEPINITLTLTNISNQTVNFGLDDDFSYFEFRVYNDTNGTIYSSFNNGGFHYPLCMLETLNAGESLSDGYSWHQTAFSPEGVPVSLGTYYIVGQVGPIYYGTNSTIETTPIQVTID